MTPVWSASCNGHTAVVKLLIENGADISICNEVCSLTFVIGTCNRLMCMTDSWVCLLREENLTCNNFYLISHVQNGASPLLIAGENGHTAIVDILIEAGGDVHQATTKVLSTVVVELVSAFVQPMSFTIKVD